MILNQIILFFLLLAFGGLSGWIASMLTKIRSYLIFTVSSLYALLFYLGLVIDPFHQINVFLFGEKFSDLTQIEFFEEPVKSSGIGLYELLFPIYITVVIILNVAIGVFILLAFLELHKSRPQFLFSKLFLFISISLFIFSILIRMCV